MHLNTSHMSDPPSDNWHAVHYPLYKPRQITNKSASLSTIWLYVYAQLHFVISEPLKMKVDSSFCDSAWCVNSPNASKVNNLQKFSLSLHLSSSISSKLDVPFRPSWHQLPECRCNWAIADQRFEIKDGCRLRMPLIAVEPASLIRKDLPGIPSAARSPARSTRAAASLLPGRGGEAAFAVAISWNMELVR